MSSWGLIRKVVNWKGLYVCIPKWQKKQEPQRYKNYFLLLLVDFCSSAGSSCLWACLGCSGDREGAERDVWALVKGASTELYQVRLCICWTWAWEGNTDLWLVKEWVRKVRDPTLGLRGTEVLVICSTSRMKAGERRPEGEEMVDSIYTRCYERACSLHKLYWTCITPLLSHRKQKWSQGWFSRPVSPFLFLYIPW